MLPYWALFGIPALATLFERRHARHYPGGHGVLLATISVCLMIGLRFQVGGDWGAYLAHFSRASYTEPEVLLVSGDPGYMLLNWIVARVGAKIWLVNIVCAVLFTFGLFAFVTSQPRPWLALAIAVPYLIVVVAMGYTRQAVAIGLAMRGLVALGNERSNLRFVMWVLLAATFHKSAVLLIPIAALAEDRGRLWTGAWVGAATLTAYFVLLEGSVDQLVYGYVEQEYDSSGAAIRVTMNAMPALLFVVFRRKLLLRPAERRLWLIMALIALALVPALIMLPSSTAVDRLGLYLIPLQILVLSRVPDSFSRTDRTARFLGLLVVGYSAAVLFVWLNFASHANQWLPYRLYPF